MDRTAGVVMTASPIQLVDRISSRLIFRFCEYVSFNEFPLCYPYGKVEIYKTVPDCKSKTERSLKENLELTRIMKLF